MPRLIIIALVAGVAALAVAAPDQAAAAPVDLERDQRAAAAAVDLENEQRHDVFDDALDEADALLAPDHAAGIRAELDLMKDVLEEQKSVIDSLESTAAAEAALARDDPYLAVEPTHEVEPEVADLEFFDARVAAEDATDRRFAIIDGAQRAARERHEQQEREVAGLLEPLPDPPP